MHFAGLYRKAQDIQSEDGYNAAEVYVREQLKDHHDLPNSLAKAVSKDVLQGDDASFRRVAAKLQRNDTSSSQMRVLSKASDELVIYGPASVDLVDREGDQITGPALEKALPQLLKRARFSLQHLDILVGEILPKYKHPDSGKVYKTEVREVMGQDLRDFPKLKENGVERGDDALFCVGKIYDDAKYQDEVREGILKGELDAFSISGQSVSETAKMECDGFECKVVNRIDEIDLSAVTICADGMNPGAQIKVVKKSCGCRPGCPDCTMGVSA